MASELQQQVARLRSNNAFIGSVSSEFHRFSSIFLNAKDAAGIDTEVIYEAAVSGLLELRQYDNRFGHYLDNLLHPSSTSLQRELKTAEENKVLDRQLAILFQHLSIFCNEPSSHRIFEYLVRRYHVHEHNVESFLRCVLSIHDSKIFARIVQLCTITNSRWTFLEGVKKTGSPIPRSIIARKCKKDNSLLDVVCSMVTGAMRLLNDTHSGDDAVTTGVNRIISFVTATIIEFADEGSVGDSHMRQLIPVLLEGLRGKTYILSSKTHPVHQWRRSTCMIIIQIARKTTLAKPTLISFTKEFTHAISNVYSDNTNDETHLHLAVEVLSGLIIFAQYQDLIISESILILMCSRAESSSAENTPFLTALMASRLKLNPERLLQFMFRGASAYLLSLKSLFGSNGEASLISEEKENDFRQVARTITGLIRADMIDLVALKSHTIKCLKELPKMISKHEILASSVFEEFNISVLQAISQRQPEVFDTCSREALSGEEGQEVPDSDKECIRDLLVKVFASSTYRINDIDGIQLLLAINHSSRDVRIRALQLFGSTVPLPVLLSDELESATSRDIVGLAQAAIRNSVDMDIDVVQAAWFGDVVARIIRYVSFDEFSATLFSVWEDWQRVSFRLPLKSLMALHAIMSGLRCPDVLVELHTMMTHVSSVASSHFRKWMQVTLILTVYDGGLSSSPESSSAEVAQLESSIKNNQLSAFNTLVSAAKSGILFGLDGLKSFKGVVSESSAFSDAIVTAFAENLLRNPESTNPVLVAFVDAAYDRVDGQLRCSLSRITNILNLLVSILKEVIKVVSKKSKGLSSSSTSHHSALVFLSRLITPFYLFHVHLLEKETSQLPFESMDRIVDFGVQLIQLFSSYPMLFLNSDASAISLRVYLRNCVSDILSSDLPSRLLSGLLSSGVPQLTKLVGRCLTSCFSTCIPATLLRIISTSNEAFGILPYENDYSSGSEPVVLKLSPITKAAAIYTLSTYYSCNIQKDTMLSSECTMSLFALLPTLISSSSSGSRGIRKAALSLANRLASFEAILNVAPAVQISSASYLLASDSLFQASIKLLDKNTSCNISVVAVLGKILSARSSSIEMDPSAAVSTLATDLFKSDGVGASGNNFNDVRRWLLWTTTLLGWEAPQLSKYVYSAAAADGLSVTWKYVQSLISNESRISCILGKSNLVETEAFADVLLKSLVTAHSLSIAQQIEVAESVANLINIASKASVESIDPWLRSLSQSSRSIISQGFATFLCDSAKSILFNALVGCIVESPGETSIISCIVQIPVGIESIIALVGDYAGKFRDQCKKSLSVQSFEADKTAAASVDPVDDDAPLVLGLSDPIRRITTVMEAISATSFFTGAALSHSSSIGEGVSRLAALLADLFILINNRGFRIILTIEYSKIIILDLLALCLTTASSFLISSNTSSDGTNVAGDAKTPKKTKKGKISDPSADDTKKLAYDFNRIPTDIEEILKCMATARSDQLQIAALKLLQSTLNLQPSSIHTCIATLGRLVGQASVGTHYNNKEVFIDKILRLITDTSTTAAFSSKDVALGASAGNAMTLAQDILQPLCHHFANISRHRRSQLSSIAISALGDTSLPALINTLLILSLHSFDLPNSTSDTHVLGNISSTEDSIILLSRNAQKKFHRLAITSTPEELFRLAIETTVQQSSAAVQLGNISVQLKLVQRLIHSGVSYFSHNHSGSSQIIIEDPMVEENGDVIISTSNDKLCLKVSAVSSYFLALDQEPKIDSSIALTDDERISSSSLALAMLTLEYIGEFLGNKSFHRNLVSFMGKPQAQQVFLEISEQLLELLSLGSHIQQSSGSTNSNPLSLKIKLGATNIAIGGIAFGKTLFESSLDMLESLQRILDAPVFVQILEELLSHPHTGVRNKALQILAKRLETMSRTKSSSSDEEATLFLDLSLKLRASIQEIIPQLTAILDKNSALHYEDPKIGHCQSALLCLDSMSRYLGRRSQWISSMISTLSELVELSMAISNLTCQSLSKDAAIKNDDQNKSSRKLAKKKDQVKEVSLLPVVGIASASYAGLCKLLGSIYLCCGTLCSVLGPRALPVLSKLMGTMLKSLECQSCKILEGEEAGLGDISRSRDAQAHATNLSRSRVLLVRSIVSSIAVVIKEIPTFSHPFIKPILSNLLPMYNLSIDGDSSLNGDIDICLNNLYTKIPHRLLVPAVYETADAQLAVNHSTATRFVKFLSEIWVSYDRSAITGHISQLCALATLGLDYRRVYGDQSTEGSANVDEAAVHGVVDFCVKLTEAELKSFLVRLGEWKDVTTIAASETTKTSPDAWRRYSRGVTFYHLVSSLASRLMSLFLPCMGALWLNAADCLKEFATISSDVTSVGLKSESSQSDPLLDGKSAGGKSAKKRKSIEISQTSHVDATSEPTISLMRELQLRTEYVLTSIQTCCAYTTAEFLDDNRYDVMMNAVVGVLGSRTGFASDETYISFCDDYTVPCVVALATAINNDLQWKPLNRKVLMMTRDKKKSVRLVAVKTLHKLFLEVGEEYLLLLPECLPYFSELLEDDSQEITTVASTLVRYIEEVSGESLDSYLQ